MSCDAGRCIFREGRIGWEMRGEKRGVNSANAVSFDEPFASGEEEED